MAPSQEIAIRAVGTALAGMSIAFAVYMLAYGGGKTRVNGLEHLAIFAQPRGSAGAPHPADGLAPNLNGAGAAKPEPRPIEIVAARADRVWLRIDGAIRSAVPGDSVASLGHIGAIVARDGGWVVLDDKGTALLAVTKGANGAALFARDKIFE